MIRDIYRSPNHPSVVYARIVDELHQEQRVEFRDLATGSHGLIEVYPYRTPAEKRAATIAARKLARRMAEQERASGVGSFIC